MWIQQKYVTGQGKLHLLYQWYRNSLIWISIQIHTIKSIQLKKTKQPHCLGFGCKKSKYNNTHWWSLIKRSFWVHSDCISASNMGEFLNKTPQYNEAVDQTVCIAAYNIQFHYLFNSISQLNVNFFLCGFIFFLLNTNFQCFGGCARLWST